MYKQLVLAAIVSISAVASQACNSAYTVTTTGVACPSTAPNACGSACFDASKYTCVLNQGNLTASTLVQVTQATAAPATGCSESTATTSPSGSTTTGGSGNVPNTNNICALIYQEGTQDSSCNILHADGTTLLQCYNPLCYTCTATGQLCPANAPNSCGAACYDPNEYTCTVNAANYFASTLVQIPNGKQTLTLPAICPGSGSPLAGTNGTVSQGFGTGAEIIQTTAPAAAAESVGTPVFITLPPAVVASITPAPSVAATAAPVTETATETVTAAATSAATAAAAATVETTTQAATVAATPAPQPTGTPSASQTIPPAGQAVTTNVCADIYQEGDQDQTCNTLTPSGEIIVQCYNPACYTCTAAGPLCPANAPAACGVGCYDPGLATCSNGNLTPIVGGVATAYLPAKCPGGSNPQNGTEVITPTPGSFVSGSVATTSPATTVRATTAASTTSPATTAASTTRVATTAAPTTATSTTAAPTTAASTTAPPTTATVIQTEPATTNSTNVLNKLRMLLY